ncbi:MULTISPECIES: MauE/DoxX family redox-associated membrane protein [unclassified Psychrobacter]|uniref:MauE/DoxX family redox-associated membrane protein n=1 Tax=unclassified Psychrobacter TaxID=196806 RepID=UPI00041A82AA|nr:MULTISPECIES: MauE/DoxX family redox-associated membrane protein [unclassified Psychrobacter]
MADNTTHQSESDTIDDSHSPQVQHLIDTLQGEHIGKEGGQSAIIFRMVMPDHLCPFGLKSIDALKHAGYDIIDRHITTQDENTLVKDTLGVKTTPQTFIDGKRIGGNDDLQVFLGNHEPETDDDTTYTPIIAIFAVTALMTLALCWAFAVSVFSIQALMWFVALSMCVLAIKKLEDLEGFTTGFLGYDLLARRVVRYAYVYPFLEAFAGIAMLADQPWLNPIAGLVAFIIGLIGGVSVIKAVYIDKRELKCACVGGDSNVPLGAISLTENVMMFGMGGYMLIRALL